MHILRNDALQIAVKTTGAELASIRNQETGQEYMWDAQPDIWGNHAPVLFPIVGGLKDGKYYHEGQEYRLPRHGFIRYNEDVELRNQTETQLTFGLRYNEQTLSVYPFQFDFQVHFILEGKTLRINHEVQNLGDGPMWFSLGAHPAFKCPFFDGENYDDYLLAFEHTENDHTWLLDAGGQLAQPGPQLLDQSDMLPLYDHLFDNDALIFKNLRSRRITLLSQLSGPVLTVHFEGWPYMGIWAKPQAPFVCIEPWQGIADSADTDQQLVNKEGIMRLEGQKSYSAAYEIEIH